MKKTPEILAEEHWEWIEGLWESLPAGAVFGGLMTTEYLYKQLLYTGINMELKMSKTMRTCPKCKNEYESRRGQRVNLCGACMYERQKARMRKVYHKKYKHTRRMKRPKLEKRKCLWCKEWFQPTHHIQRYCPDKKCQKAAATECQWQMYKNGYTPKKNRLNSQPDKPKKYTCRICGQNAYPNRFFCPPCHSKIGHNDTDDWYRLDGAVMR